MGHRLPGSRGNYYDFHDVDEAAQKYMKVNFSRAGWRWTGSRQTWRWLLQARPLWSHHNISALFYPDHIWLTEAVYTNLHKELGCVPRFVCWRIKWPR